MFRGFHLDHRKLKSKFERLFADIMAYPLMEYCSAITRISVRLRNMLSEKNQMAHSV